MKRIGLLTMALSLFLFAQAAQAQWTLAKRITWTPGESYNPIIAVGSNGFIHVVWEDNTPYNREIYYKRSEDGGATWSTAKRLSWTSGDSEHPSIAVDSNNHITVVWSDYTPNSGEIFFRRSLDGGTKWGLINRLTWTASESRDPTMVIDISNKIHVVWDEESEIYYMSSADGISFSLAKMLSNNSGDATQPAIAISGSTICVVWQDYAYFDTCHIYYRTSGDGGEIWSPVKELPTYSLDHYYSPAVAISGSTIHVVWEDYTPGYPEIYYMRSVSGGAFLNQSIRLTWTLGDSRCPAIAKDSNNSVHVVWYDNTPGNFEIYYKKRN